MMEQVRSFLETTIFETGGFKLQVFHVANILLIFFLVRLLLWGVRKFFERKRKEGKLDQGKVFAIYQMIRYLTWVIAIVVAIDSLGFEITVILAGSTALLVGLGLGLQDFFRDLVASFIILTERTVTVGDIVEIDGVVGQVKHVGLRTTSLLTRDDIVLLVPNTRFTTEHVTNWSQNKRVTRFRVHVGVAYGSDVELVRRVLMQCAKENKDVKAIPEPSVFFEDFGNSSLDFSVVFYSENLYRIERTKSDLRFAIEKAFRKNNITIPFPQRDLWIREKPQT